MRIFRESKQKHLYFSAAFALSLTLAPAGVYAGTNTSTMVQAVQQNDNHKVTGRVVDSTGGPLIGATVLAEDTANSTVTDIDGNYTLDTTANAKSVSSYIGHAAQTIPVGGKGTIDVTLKEEANTMNEVVVTAMGIMHKEKSLTYATQQVKTEDLMKVRDSSAANSLEGKVAGIAIMPSVGGAGGASKIILHGNCSILDSSSPFIVVDGAPMNNGIRSQQDMDAEGFGSTGISEDSDPLSSINPDDIESVNVLKGANAAALYGSHAANGVVMITTKRSHEDKVNINVTSGITFDSPLLIPEIQKTYDAAYDQATGALSLNNWGDKLADRADNDLVVRTSLDERWVGCPEEQVGINADGNPVMARRHNVYLRSRAGNDADDFFRAGITTDNSVSLSGDTEMARTYVSVANSHATDVMRNNSYNRNFTSFRQTYNFLERLHIDASLNYTESKTKNRPGGGTVGNPLYHLYTAPQNTDMDHYRSHYMSAEDKWLLNPASYYRLDGKNFAWTAGQRTTLTDPQQEWAYLSHPNNNPYWLINSDNNQQKGNRLFDTLQTNVNIYDGLTFQARVNYNQIRFENHATHFTTIFLPTSMEDYGRLWDSDEKTTEFYADYLLSYSKTFGDCLVSATVGYVGHTIKDESRGTDAVVAYYDRLMRKLPTVVDYFETSAGGYGVISTSKSSDWDRSYLFTAQLSWKGTVYFDASYRRDWYHPFRCFRQSGKTDTDSYGYFGVDANAIVSRLVKLSGWFNFLKYRVSYSSAGNSIPNEAYGAMGRNLQTGALSGNRLLDFSPVPEETGSFETGTGSLFLNNRLGFDFTFYNTIVHHLYVELGSLGDDIKLSNSVKIRNTGFETTVGYGFRFDKNLRWRISYNLSYNDNGVLEAGYNKDGTSHKYQQTIGEAKVIYQKDGAIGDIYTGDFMRGADGHIILTAKSEPTFDKAGSDGHFLDNMSSKWQIGWTDTFDYKEFQLSFLINGRIGGKVLSLAESCLDRIGVSGRAEATRLSTEYNDIVVTDYDSVPGIELNDGSGRIVPIQSYYQALGASSNPSTHLYNGTNFRPRELSLGYTFRNLFSMNRDLTLSFIARNLFFIYRDAPTDPDVPLSTQNSLDAFESFNMPSPRSFDPSLKTSF